MKVSKKISTNFMVTGAAVVISLVLAILIIALTSDAPFEALKQLVLGPLQSSRKIGLVFQTAIPIIFTGLGLSLMFQSKQFNLSPDGIFYFTAAFASYIGIHFNLASFIHPAVGILVCGIIGALICSIPAILKIKWDSNVIVSSLMLNYILLYAGLYVLRNVVRDTDSGNMVSKRIAETAKLSDIIPATGIHSGLILAIIAVVVCYIFIYKTKWGYEIRMTGHNIDFAKYTGINIVKAILMAQLIGGFLSGVGGAVEMYGVYNRFEWLANPGYGWSGFIAATLAKNNPAYVPVAALFLSYLSVGSDIIVRTAGVSPDVIPTIRGIMIVLIASENFLSAWKHKRMVKQISLGEEGDTK